MFTLTIPQARHRFKTLSPVLRETIFSVQTAEIISRIAEQNHLTGGKIGSVAEAAGLVLLGFIHPEEVAKEIEDRAHLDRQISKMIADSLDNRIFRPLRDEIDQAYAPLPAEPLHIMTGIEAPRVETSELPSFLREKPSTPPAFTPFSGIPSAIPKPPPPRAGAPPPGERQNQPRAPEPFILHRESEFSPQKKSFDLGSSAERPFTRETFGGKPQSSFGDSPKPARLEIGRGPEPMRAPPPAPSAPRVVHYSDLTTPLHGTPPQAAPSRGTAAPPPSTPPPQSSPARSNILKSSFLTPTPGEPRLPSLPPPPRPPDKPAFPSQFSGPQKPIAPPPGNAIPWMPKPGAPPQKKEEVIDTVNLRKIPPPPSPTT